MFHVYSKIRNKNYKLMVPVSKTTIVQLNSDWTDQRMCPFQDEKYKLKQQLPRSFTFTDNNVVFSFLLGCARISAVRIFRRSVCTRQRNWATGRGRRGWKKERRAKVADRAVILTRISLEARKETSETSRGKEDRSWEDTSARELEENFLPLLSLAPSHAAPSRGWLTHHYRQFINSQ